MNILALFVGRSSQWLILYYSSSVCLGNILDLKPATSVKEVNMSGGPAVSTFGASSINFHLSVYLHCTADRPWTFMGTASLEQ